MEKKTTIYLVIIGLLVVICAGAVIIGSATVHGYKTKLADAQEQNQRIADELRTSLEANRAIRATLERSADANRAAAESIKRSFEGATDIESIIDAIIRAVNALENAITEPDNIIQ